MTDSLSRYYAYIKRNIRGPFFPKDAALIPGFNRSTLVCTEKMLGQWVEAGLVTDFQVVLETPPAAPAKPKPPKTAQDVEEAASRSLLERAIAKNAQLEREVKDLRRSYNAEKGAFEASLRKKEGEVRILSEKLKRSIDAVPSMKTEHPSWEMLYKTLKKRSEEKLSEITQALSEKTADMIRLKEEMHALREAADHAKKQVESALAAQAEAADDNIEELKSQVEEKDMLSRTLSENISSLLGKNEELQHIMLDERRDYEAQNKNYCEEIGRLHAELKWRDQELAKIKDELFDAVNHAKQTEAVEEIKSREQEEIYNVLSSKLKLLSGYFENLEARVKYVFR